MIMMMTLYQLWGASLPHVLTEPSVFLVQCQHPTLKYPVSPFKDGKGSFSTGWWLAFHHYNREMKEYADIRKDIICCNLCGAQVKRGERARATSALVQHLKTKIHRKVFDQLTVLWEGKARDPLVPRKPSAGPRKTGATAGARAKKGEEKAYHKQMEAITRFMAATNQPMHVVETDAFRQMAEVLQSTARFPVKATAADVIQEMDDLDAKIQQNNKNALQGEAVWTTQGVAAGGEYVLLTCSFINPSFEAKGLMLEAKKQVPDPKASEYLEDTASWGIAPGLSYVAGVASNAGFVSSPTDSAGSSMGAQLDKTKGIFHVEFVDQKLASTAQVAFDYSFAPGTSTSHVLEKARALVALYGPRFADLKKVQEDMEQKVLTMVPDSAAFWWTTCDMIARLLALRPALEKLFVDDLSLTDWDVLQQLGIVLEPLVAGVKALASAKPVTASLALSTLVHTRSELAKLPPSACASALLSQFDKTWGSLDEPFQGGKPRAGARKGQKGLHWSLLFAYALDPRFKTLPDIRGKGKETLFDALLKEMVQTKKQAESACAAELKAYQEEKALEADADPLEWWKVHQTSFPTLASLARVYLAIPVSAATLDTTFGNTDLATKPAVEMAKERLNIRANAVEPAPVATVPVVTSPVKTSVEAMTIETV